MYFMHSISKQILIFKSKLLNKIPDLLWYPGEIKMDI